MIRVKMLRCNVVSNDMEVDEIVESDVELDNSEVVDPDDDPQQKVGNIEVGFIDG